MTQIHIIEDDDQLRMMLRQMLERSGYEVMEASNGTEGIKRFREKPCDLVITDLIMPEKEGLETIKELKEIVPDLKIIAVSGDGRVGPQDYLHLAKTLGATQTLTKPIEREKLLNTVKELLR